MVVINWMIGWVRIFKSGFRAAFNFYIISRKERYYLILSIEYIDAECLD